MCGRPNLGMEGSRTKQVSQQELMTVLFVVGAHYLAEPPTAWQLQECLHSPCVERAKHRASCGLVRDKRIGNA